MGKFTSNTKKMKEKDRKISGMKKGTTKKQ